MSGELEKLHRKVRSAIRRGSELCLLKHLRWSKELTKKLTKSRCDGIREAIDNGKYNIEIIKILSDHGFDINRYIELFDIIFTKQYELIIYLINSGAKIYSPKSNVTVLDMMVYKYYGHNNDDDHCLKFEILTNHFLIIKVSQKYIDSRMMILIKNSYILGREKFMIWCKLSLSCKTRITEKVFKI